MEHSPKIDPSAEWTDAGTEQQTRIRRRRRIALIALLLALALAACLLLPRLRQTPAEAQPSPAPTDAPIATDAPSGDPAAGLTVTFLDVGQGDCIFLRAPGGETMLVDAGYAYAFDTLDAFLTAQNVVGLDVAVASHLHADHIGGLIELIDTYPVGVFYRPPFDAASETFYDLIDALEESNARTKTPYAGVNTLIDWADGVEVRILSPYQVVYDDFNDTSFILRVRYGETAVLLTGDAGEVAERLALKAQPNHLFGANVLKVGHHGSKNGTLDGFLDAVNPEIAVICCGENDYGLPNEALLDRLNARGVTLLRTDEDGTITLLLDGTGVQVLE